MGAQSFESIVELALALGEVAHVTRLCGAAEAIRQATELSMTRDEQKVHDSVVAAARSAGRPAFRPRSRPKDARCLSRRRSLTRWRGWRTIRRAAPKPGGAAERSSDVSRGLNCNFILRLTSATTMSGVESCWSRSSRLRMVHHRRALLPRYPHPRETARCSPISRPTSRSPPHTSSSSEGVARVRRATLRPAERPASTVWEIRRRVIARPGLRCGRRRAPRISWFRSRPGSDFLRRHGATAGLGLHIALELGDGVAPDSRRS